MRKNKIKKKGVSLRSKHSYLAGYLCQEREKGKDSQWFPYIDILPTAFNTVPIFFDKEKLDMLTGSIALKKISDRIASLRDEYNDICAHVPEFKRIRHEDFVWGRLVVITRIFGLVVDNEKTDGLVPLADMLNHKRPRETKWTYDQKRRGFVVTALQTVQKDCEVFDSYGGKCNSRFFVNYGFSLEENEDNEAAITLEFPKNDPQFNLKANFLKLNPLDQKKVKECFSWLRVAHAQGNEYMTITAQNLQVHLPFISLGSYFLSDDIPPLSVRNELMVLTSLAVAAKKSLNGFKTTLEEDNKLLEDTEKFPKFSNMRNIVLMRRGEKEVM
ncbi:SET domain containing protein [Reticulomyxa filosa]|uniref:SET domain containing protein n=1 Tax=Reticulomyxa filosa TaxID=46433 RepID=X6NN19_RETFI|nr:SET domain containing protein [Reticulomyxa filosa]|eukprot:ETO27333.1 SET domain containing protein [Reticulomyxa filosa]